MEMACSDNMFDGKGTLSILFLFFYFLWLLSNGMGVLVVKVLWLL